MDDHNDTPSEGGQADRHSNHDGRDDTRGGHGSSVDEREEPRVEQSMLEDEAEDADEA
uniref:hypothetical protein n=1 Tax=Halorussus salinisoli TaxID=2558242 RepID=UPI0014859265|nr:hypothetical protein [Halorussus salinisoli]